MKELQDLIECQKVGPASPEPDRSASSISEGNSVGFRRDSSGNESALKRGTALQDSSDHRKLLLASNKYSTTIEFNVELELMSLLSLLLVFPLLFVMVANTFTGSRWEFGSWEGMLSGSPEPPFCLG